MSEAAVETTTQEAPQSDHAEGSQETTSQQQSDSSNYDQRVQSDPGFALEQVKHWQKQATKLREELKTWDPLKPYSQFGADQILSYAQRAARAEQDPRMKQILETFLETGNVTGGSASASDTASSDLEDEYQDPQIRSLREELESLKRERDGDRRRLAQAESRGFQAPIQKNVDEFMGSIPASMPELREKAAERINQRLRDLEGLVAQGNQAAREQLESFAKTGEGGGLETMQMLCARLINENMEAIVAARQNEKARKVADHATSQRSTVATSPEKDTGAPTRGLSTPDLVREALRKATEAQGRTKDIWDLPIRR